LTKEQKYENFRIVQLININKKSRT